MILHVCNLDKFIPPLIKFINEEFGEEKHQFWLAGVKKLKQYPIESADNIFICNRSIVGGIFGYLKLLIMLHRARKVILHGLFNPRVLLILTLCPWILKKCYWVLWGGDYLYREHAPRDWKYWIKEPFHRFVKKRIENLITYIPESVYIVQRLYGCEARWHECLCYPSNTFVERTKPEKRSVSDEIIILVGNSATSTNQHFDAFDIISPFVFDNAKIYVPLSYGDESYAQKVIEKGKALFGDQFYPMLNFIPRSEYQDFLDEVDIVVFNHNRHQAMGTIINILGLGKTLYMNTDVASWSFLNRLGVDVYSISNMKSLEVRADEEKNRRLVKEYFSVDNLKHQWGEIFEK